MWFSTSTAITINFVSERFGILRTMLGKIAIAHCESIPFTMKYLIDHFVFIFFVKCTCSQLLAVTGQAMKFIDNLKRDTATFKFNTRY